MWTVSNPLRVHQQPQHALVAGARTFIWPWQCLRLGLRVGCRWRPTHASLHVHVDVDVDVHVHVHGHCPRAISHASISDLRAHSAQFQCLLCSARRGAARVCPGLPSVCTWIPASILLGSGSRVRPSGPRSRSIFMANWQLALNFSSSFIVYAFTYAPKTCSCRRSTPHPTALPLLWHLARFLFKIHNCRRQRRVIVGEFRHSALSGCVSPYPLTCPAPPPHSRRSSGCAKKSITFLHMFQLRVTLRRATLT